MIVVHCPRCGTAVECAVVVASVDAEPLRESRESWLRVDFEQAMPEHRCPKRGRMVT